MVAIKIGKQKWTRKDAQAAYSAFWQEMMPVLTESVVKTFDRFPVNVIKRSEIKRRTELGKELVDVLKCELHWSKQRIKAHIDTVLDLKLAGLDIDYDSIGKRQSW